MTVRCQGDEEDFAHDGSGWSKRGLGRGRRQILRCEAEPLGHNLASEVDVLPPFELGPHNAHTGCRCRAQASQPRGSVQCTLHRKRDELLHINRCQAGMLGDHRDRGSGKIWQHLDRESRERVPAPTQDTAGSCQHQRAIGERPTDERVQHGSVNVAVRGGLKGG